MDYIKWIRSKVGHEKIFLNFSGACITNEDGQILLQKRSKDEEIWGIPGGALELGESIEEALIREIREETGFDIKIERLIGIYSKYFHLYPNGDEAQTICYFFKCTISGGELTMDNIETFDLRFFDRDKIPELFNKQNQDMIEDYLNNKINVVIA